MLRSINLRNHAVGIFVAFFVAAWIWSVNSQHSVVAAHQYNVKEVSALQAKSMIAAGAVVIDVRGDEAYKRRHIPSAILMPLELLRLGIPASLQALKTKNIVIYCGDGVTRGLESTELLNKAGFAQAVNLQRGLDGWADAGLPVQKN